MVRVDDLVVERRRRPFVGKKRRKTARMPPITWPARRGSRTCLVVASNASDTSCVPSPVALPIVPPRKSEGHVRAVRENAGRAGLQVRRYADRCEGVPDGNEYSAVGRVPAARSPALVSASEPSLESPAQPNRLVSTVSAFAVLQVVDGRRPVAVAVLARSACCRRRTRRGRRGSRARRQGARRARDHRGPVAPSWIPRTAAPYCVPTNVVSVEFNYEVSCRTSCNRPCPRGGRGQRSTSR